MTVSHTRTASDTFSLASARYIASKVATDLRQLQRYYGRPSDAEIADYAEEAAILAHHRYVDKVVYGFRRNDNWILTLEYTAVDGMLTADDRAGGVYRNADLTGATFFSLMTMSLRWVFLPSEDQEEINKSLPFIRSPGTELGYAGGYHTFDRTYSTQGTGFTRSSYRPL